MSRWCEFRLWNGRCRSCQHVDSIFHLWRRTYGRIPLEPSLQRWRHRDGRIPQNPEILTGLTLRTPQRPKDEIFCIRRSNIISIGRTALPNALNIAFLRSSLTEIRCSKISENSENRHRAHIADPQAAKGLEILYTSKRNPKYWSNSPTQRAKQRLSMFKYYRVTLLWH